MSVNRPLHTFPKSSLVTKATREILALQATREILALPFVEVPPRGSNQVETIPQTFFRAERFCLYADDASKLRTHLWFGTLCGGTSSSVELPAGLFADGPLTDRSPLVLHCSQCGAPTKEGAARCTFCQAPFTWRLTDTAFGMHGLTLSFPAVSPGVSLIARFTNRSDKPIGVDAAFIGESMRASGPYG